MTNITISNLYLSLFIDRIRCVHLDIYYILYTYINTARSFILPKMKWYSHTYNHHATPHRLSVVHLIRNIRWISLCRMTCTLLLYCHLDTATCWKILKLFTSLAILFVPIYFIATSFRLCREFR